MVHFPEQKVIQTLLELLSIQSPAGHAEQAIQYVDRRLKQAGLQTVFANKGGLRVVVPGEDQRQHRFVTVHVDTLGAMVKEIKPNGRLKLSKIGGFGWFSVDGVYCYVETRKGELIPGTILSSHTSVHVYDNAETQKRSEETMEIRLDARVRSSDEAKALGISVGDFVSFDPWIMKTETGFIKARHLDDKASAAVLIELLAAIREMSVVLPYTTHFYFSNFEEVGFGANSNIPALVREYVAVDIGAVGEGQVTNEYGVSICAKDGTGPYLMALPTN